MNLACCCETIFRKNNCMCVKPTCSYIYFIKKATQWISNNKTNKIRSNYKMMEQQNQLYYMDGFYISYILKVVLAFSGDDMISGITWLLMGNEVDRLHIKIKLTVRLALVR